MTYEQQALLYLLRLGIGNDTESGFDFTGVDWRNLVDSSFAQGVPALAVDGLRKLYDENPDSALGIDRPEFEALKYEWFGSCFSAEGDYERHQSAIAEFLKLCKLQEVKVLLLKGYGLSLNYPIPAHRPCGDIDIYLFGYAEFVSQLVEKHWGLSVDRSNPFDFNSLTLYHITSFLCELVSPCASIAFVFVVIYKVMDAFTFSGYDVHFTLRKTVHLPLPKIVQAKLPITIDWDFVYGFAKDFGCTPFLNCLNGICVESLGFATEDFPIRERNGKLQSRMLADILHPEFQEEIPASSHKLRYAIVKTRRILANRWKYRMVSDERIGVTIFNLAKKRI